MSEVTIDSWCSKEKHSDLKKGIPAPVSRTSPPGRDYHTKIEGGAQGGIASSVLSNLSMHHAFVKGREP